MSKETQYISAIHLDEKSLMRRSAEIEHERIVAINDLIEWNHFSLKDSDAKGPYEVGISATENRLTLQVKPAGATKALPVNILIASFRSIIRDYFLICESYFDAIKTGNLSRIEAIDMSRRGLHNEGAELLADLIKDKVKIDTETARRLFTLICALHLK